MKVTARNRTAKFRYLAFLMLMMASLQAFAGNDIHLPDFYEYNRSIHEGSEISEDVRYQGQPASKLVIGTVSPLIDTWMSHSTLTTGLFAVPPLVNRAFVFKLRAEKKKCKTLKSSSVLWVSARFFDRYGVYLESSPGVKIPVPEHWIERSFHIASKNTNTAYVEIWFVKFEDADKSGKTNHPIYLSGLEIQQVP